MMKKNRYFWSPSTAGFFDNQVSDMSTAPDDLIPVTLAKWNKLLAANQQGAAIISDVDGAPISVYPEKAAPVDLKRWAMRSIKREAKRRIERIFPLSAQMNSMRACGADDPRFAAIDAIRSASNLIEQDLANSENIAEFPIATHPLWPESKNDG